VTPDDSIPAVATIVLAFASDPMARWSWPQSHQYLSAMPKFAQVFGGNGFAHGGAHATEGYIGVALWLPPGVRADEEALAEITQSTVSPSIRDDLAAVFGRMANYHPHEPHWFLPFIGVDPAHQGKGHGDALMTYALKRCDRDRTPAYLESSNPRNISLYRRHGFKELGTIQAGSSPTLIPMLRPARRPAA
jgi:ribosomal protein S18 acetylase RimI-like enzyme